MSGDWNALPENSGESYKIGYREGVADERARCVAVVEGMLNDGHPGPDKKVLRDVLAALSATPTPED